MRFVYLNPNNFRQSYVTTLRNDSNVPAGYILSRGSDGAPDEALQQYIGGVNSLCPDLRATPLAAHTAFYVDDPTQDAVAAALKTKGAKGLWINGILGGGTGDT